MTLQLRKGGFYRDGHGEVRGPARPRNPDCHDYPWLVGDNTYTNSGSYSNEGPLLDDLTEEVSVGPVGVYGTLRLVQLETTTLEGVNVQLNRLERDGYTVVQLIPTGQGDPWRVLLRAASPVTL